MDTTVLQSFSILSGVSSSNAASSVDLDELTETENNFVDLLSQFSGRRKNDSLALRVLGVDQLKESDGKGCGFACSGLCLSDGVPFADDGGNTLLLNNRGLFEPES